MLILLSLVFCVLCGVGVRARRGVIINRLTTLPVNTCKQPNLTSFPFVMRLQNWVGQWNVADVECLDFTSALNQIAYDILVDKMEERVMHLLEWNHRGLKYHIQRAEINGIMSAWKKSLLLCHKTLRLTPSDTMSLSVTYKKADISIKLQWFKTRRVTTLDDIIRLQRARIVLNDD